MMSVFCSKTLIFAPECWKCILKGLDFENFLGDLPLECLRNRCEFFFHLFLIQIFCHLLKTLLKTLIRNLIANDSKIKPKGHVHCSVTQPAKTDLSPCSLPLGDVS